MPRSALVSLFAVLSLVVSTLGAAAQDYPTRPIRALTTASAGGISDVFMRALGDRLGARLGQPIVVENRPGGMQNVGARACPAGRGRAAQAHGSRMGRRAVSGTGSGRV